MSTHAEDLLEEQEGSSMTNPTPVHEAEPDPFALSDEKIYLDERQRLVKRRDELGDIFDKGRVALAGGAIALTVTISKDLVSGMTPEQRVTLAVGWLLLTASLLCAVLAVHRAGLAYDRQVDVLDDDRTSALEQSAKSEPPRDRANRHAKLLERFNIASIWLLGLGLVVGGTGMFMAFAGQPKKAEPTPQIIKLEVTSPSVKKETIMSNSDKKQSSSTPSKSTEQKSFGPKDRPVTQKPSGGGTGNTGQGGSDKK